MTPFAKPLSGRRKIVLLLTLFALPMIVAYALYFGGWRPSATGNYGELVQPARPIADMALVTLDGQPIRFSGLRGKWTLIAFAAADCPKACERNLYRMRQVIAAQGEKADRVQSILVLTDSKALDGWRYTIKDYPGMRVMVVPPPALAALARQFTLPAGSPLDNPYRIYLIDPLGNLMMSYPADADPNGLRKDLARLLRVSRIG